VFQLSLVAVATTPTDVLTSASGTAIDGLLSTVGQVLPIIIPVMAAFWGIRFVLRKVGFGKKAGL
jgi:hypothetical protein